MEWTDEIISRLQTLWQEGLSTAEIGRQLSITKNAVVGKAHRLGLSPRPSPIRASAKPRKEVAKDPTTSPVVGALPAAALGVREVTIAESPVAERTVAPNSPKVGKEHVSATPERVLSASSAADAPSILVDDVLATGNASPTRKTAETKNLAPDLTLRPLLRPLTVDASPRRGPACSWPNGDPGTPGFHFCGAKPVPGKPYCAEHCAVAYVKLRDRRESAG